jgi:glucose/arabinose dehydrogenase
MRPVHVSGAGDGSGRLFIVEQHTGRIRIFRDGALVATPFLDIGSLVSTGGEQGLLSVAFPPSFATDALTEKHFYVDYTDVSGDTVVARYFLESEDVADEGSAEVVLAVEQPFSNHNGGLLVFGPDDLLYVGFGDGGSGGDPQNNAQRKGRLLGKILRIDVESGETPYGIPSDNPFVGVRGADEIWALGLRNPWRFSFDRDTGDLYIGDVGQQEREEIDFEPASSDGGRNYGWNILEGRLCFDPGTNCVPPPDYSPPVTQYAHARGRCSVTGGFVYRGSEEPGLRGIYFFADFCTGLMWGLQRDGTRWEKKRLLSSGLSISSFGEDDSGELHVVGIGGSVHRLVESIP